MLGRRIAGTVCSVAFSALAVVIFPGVATAATSPSPSSSATDPGDYSAQSPLVTVTSGIVNVGGSVTVTGHGFEGGEVVDISVTYGPASHALGSGGPVAAPAAFTLRHGVNRTVLAAHAVAASDGDFSAQVPLTQTGNATITAMGERSHMSGAATVSVLPAASVASTKSTKRTLPLSNSELLILALVIVAALAAAGVFGLRGRWRGSSSAGHDVSTA